MTQIAYSLTSKAERALGQWDCTDHGPLNVTEAMDAYRTHGEHGPECRIGRAARKVRARLVDAPTVRASIAI